MPPVAKTRTPAACAAIIVALTVVAAQVAVPSAAARLWRETLSTPLASRQVGQLLAPQAHDQPAEADGDRGRHGPLGAHGGLAGERDLEVAGRRQAVADERRLEGHDPAPRAQRVAHVARDDGPQVAIRHRR